MNAIAPLRVVAALHRKVRRGGKIALITSRMGSIGDNDSGGYYGYRMSKAALNMLGANLEPSAVLKEALRVARESARDVEAEHLLDRVTILLEPGRSVIADAGVVLTTVCNIKRRPETGDIWLLTDAGYNLLLSMNNYKWYYHLISASRACEPLAAEYKVAGPLCDSGDVYFDIERHGRLPDYRLLPRDVKPGGVLALLNTGAYSLAQMFPYNGRPLPAAVIVRDGGRADLIRKRDTYDDLLTNDVW